MGLVLSQPETSYAATEQQLYAMPHTVQQNCDHKRRVQEFITF